MKFPTRSPWNLMSPGKAHAPIGRVRIIPGHPIGEKCCFAALPGSIPYEIVSGARASLVNAGTFGMTQGGPSVHSPTVASNGGLKFDNLATQSLARAITTEAVSFFFMGNVSNFGAGGGTKGVILSCPVSELVWNDPWTDFALTYYTGTNGGGGQIVYSNGATASSDSSFFLDQAGQTWAQTGFHTYGASLAVGGTSTWYTDGVALAGPSGTSGGPTTVPTFTPSNPTYLMMGGAADTNESIAGDLNVIFVFNLTLSQAEQISLNANPYQFLETVYPKSRIGNSVINVTLPLPGVAANPSIGTFRDTVSRSLNGVGANPAIATLPSTVGRTLTGVAANPAVGSFNAFVLPSVHANPAVGSFAIRADNVQPLSGVHANPGVGTFNARILTGVHANPAVGSFAIRADMTVPLTGVHANPAIGSFVYRLNSVAANPAVGSFRIRADNIRPLTGVHANPGVGTFGRTLLGVHANPGIGVYSFTGVRTPLGVHANPAIGFFTPVSDSTPSLTSWSAQFSGQYGDGPTGPPPPAPPPPPPPPPPPAQHTTTVQTGAAGALPAAGPIPALPNRISLASALLSTMGGLSGVVTNYNPGSLMRNFALAQGAELERQGLISSAKVTQNVAYSLMSIFGVSAAAAIPATGNVVFSVPVGLSRAVAISIGTRLQSIGGIQFQTTAAAVLPAGQLSITVPIIALVGGITGNLPANSINQVIGGLSVPLGVTNPTPTIGGTDQQPISVALADLASAIAALNLDSPVSIVNAVIGVSVPGTNETVQWSTLTENWVAQVAVSGSVQGFVPTPGFSVYVDNGAGTASPALLAAVKAKIDGSLSAGAKGYRPVGVPYTVSGTVPVFASLVVSGTTSAEGNAVVASGLVQAAIDNYFQGLPFGQPAYASELSAQLVNSGLGLINSLTAYLYYSSNLNTPVQVVTGQAQSRIFLASGYPIINIS